MVIIECQGLNQQLRFSSFFVLVITELQSKKWTKYM